MAAFEDGLWTRLVEEHGADRVTLGRDATNPRRRSLGLGASGIVAATIAGVLVVVLSLSGGASTAFAGWTARPITPPQAQLASAKASCAHSGADHGLPLKLTDTRGPFTIVVYSDGSSNSFCTTGPSFRNTSSWSTSPPVTVAAGKLFLWADHTATADGQSYGIMIARTGNDVSAADLTLDSGAQVTATVNNGWAVAWWPGGHHLVSAHLSTPSGMQTQTFSSYPCDIDNCRGGPHGAAPGGGPGGG